MRLVTGRPAFSLCSSIHLSQCTEGEPSKPFMYSRHCPAQKLVRRPHLPWGNIQPPWGSTRCALGPGPHLPPPVLHSLRLYTPAQLKYFPLHHVPSSLAPGSEHMLAPSYRTLLFSPALPVWPLSSLRSESKCEFCQDSLTPSQDQMRAPSKTHSQSPGTQSQIRITCRGILAVLCLPWPCLAPDGGSVHRGGMACPCVPASGCVHIRRNPGRRLEALGLFLLSLVWPHPYLCVMTHANQYTYYSGPGFFLFWGFFFCPEPLFILHGD